MERIRGISCRDSRFDKRGNRLSKDSVSQINVVSRVTRAQRLDPSAHHDPGRRFTPKYTLDESKDSVPFPPLATSTLSAVISTSRDFFQQAIGNIAMLFVPGDSILARFLSPLVDQYASSGQRVLSCGVVSLPATPLDGAGDEKVPRGTPRVPCDKCGF
jgi:hypothetical protein